MADTKKIRENQIIIREAGSLSGDYPKALAEIEREVFGQGGLFNEWLMVPMIRYGRVLVLLVEDEIAGSAQFMRKWDEKEAVYFYGVSLSTPYQGKGLGTYFLQEAFKLLKKDNIKRIILTVSPNNTRALYLYEEKLGFKRSRFEKDEYGPGEDRVVMELYL